MKIMHVCLVGPFTDGWAYQENILTKYHVKQGNEVVVVTSQKIWETTGQYGINRNTEYFNQDGVKIYRLPLCLGKMCEKFKKYRGLSEVLKKEMPDVLFLHGSQSIDTLTIVRYLKKQSGIKVFVDNHSDFSNSAMNWFTKNIGNKIIWRYTTQKIEPYTTKFFGVLPVRVDFLIDVYKISKEKCELLLLGADDDFINQESLSKIREEKRKEYNVEEQLVLMTGGKIDHNKPQTIDLMKAVNELGDKNITLLVFGSVTPELKESFEEQLSENVKYIGWKQSNDLYSELAVADVVIFPGLHSVLWEQAVAMGKPCIFKKIDGAMHIDIGGNCLYFEEASLDEYKKKINEAILKVDELKQNAMKDERKKFLYSNIARRSIGE